MVSWLIILLGTVLAAEAAEAPPAGGSPPPVVSPAGEDAPAPTEEAVAEEPPAPAPTEEAVAEEPPAPAPTVVEPGAPGGPPPDWELPYVRVDAERLAREQDAAWTQLLRYGARAHAVLVGTILTSRGRAGGITVVTLEVEEVLRGETADIVDFVVPPGDRLDDPTAIRPAIVHGYRVLVYLDANRELLEGNALYFLEGGYAWRNKRPDLFLDPKSDRVWEEALDPRPYYVVFSMDEVRRSLSLRDAKRRMRRRHRRS